MAGQEGRCGAHTEGRVFLFHRQQRHRLAQRQQRQRRAQRPRCFLSAIPADKGGAGHRDAASVGRYRQHRRRGTDGDIAGDPQLQRGLAREWPGAHHHHIGEAGIFDEPIAGIAIGSLPFPADALLGESRFHRHPLFLAAGFNRVDQRGHRKGTHRRIAQRISGIGHHRKADEMAAGGAREIEGGIQPCLLAIVTFDMHKDRFHRVSPLSSILRRLRPAHQDHGSPRGGRRAGRSPRRSSAATSGG